ncbi:MAG: hypothetical protein R3C28_02885 [Pirellulaceae bacterium]
MIIGLVSDGVSDTGRSSGVDASGAQALSVQLPVPAHSHECLLACNLAQDKQLPSQFCRMGWRYAFHAIFS